MTNDAKITIRSRHMRPGTYTYKRKIELLPLDDLSSYSEKKVVDNVYLVHYGFMEDELLVHQCVEGEPYKEMIFRENEDGPMYWCEACGFVLDNGAAMAVRLYEAPF